MSPPISAFVFPCSRLAQCPQIRMAFKEIVEVRADQSPVFPPFTDAGSRIRIDDLFLFIRNQDPFGNMLQTLSLANGRTCKNLYMCKA